jgi:hypothetical protein
VLQHARNEEAKRHTYTHPHARMYVFFLVGSKLPLTYTCTGEHDSDGTSTEASPVAAQTDALKPVHIGGFQADYLEGGQDEEDDDGASSTVQVPEAPVKESSSMAEPRVLRYESQHLQLLGCIQRT